VRFVSHTTYVCNWNVIGCEQCSTKWRISFYGDLFWSVLLKNVNELAGCIIIMKFVEKLTVSTLLTNSFSSQSDNTFFFEECENRENKIWYHLWLNRALNGVRLEYKTEAVIYIWISVVGSELQTQSTPTNALFYIYVFYC